MSNHLITRVGTHLPDARMRPFDHKRKTYVYVNWSEKDYSLDRIYPSLLQRAGTSWDLYTTHIIPEFTPLSNQLSAGTCVANAWCDMLEILDGLEGSDTVEQLSRRFLYWTSRYLHAATDEDKGTYNRAAGHQLMKIGVVEEKHFQYDDRPEYLISGGRYASPELDLYTMASNNRIKAFYRADTLDSEQLLQELEIAIRSNHPVVFGTPVDQEFMDYRGGGHVLGPPKDPTGNHAMIIVGVGYDGSNRWWLIRNSWGPTWGDDGHCKVNDAYVRLFEDVWVGTRMGELV